jgi:hypothetical protein
MDKELEEIAQWKKLRPVLNKAYDFNVNSENWTEAIKLFQTRLNRKFFKPIKSIIDKKILEGEGFTIVTVQCAIIESLASFRTGQIFAHKKVKGQASYIYNESGKMFVSFLHSSKIFKDNFYQIDPVEGLQKDLPFSASEFYTNVRCGLMHEARTKGQWYINATKKDVKTEKVFIEQDGAKIKLLRTILHHRLNDCVKEYLQDLKQISDDGNTLRRFFGRKLDHLFDIPVADQIGYDWWADP